MREGTPILWRVGVAGLLMILIGGCAVRSRVVLVSPSGDVEKMVDRTAREWGFHFQEQTGPDRIYVSSGLAGPSDEWLRIRLNPVGRGEVRVILKFSGPTAGSEAFFLTDLQRNLTYGTLLPIQP